MVASWDLIASNTLTSDTSTVTFSSIPSTYDDLVIKGTVKATGTNYYIQAAKRFNSDSNANYNRTALYIDFGVATLNSVSETLERYMIPNPSSTGASGYADSFSFFDLLITRYKNTSYKKMDRTSWTNLPNDGSLGLTGFYLGVWDNNNAIHTVSLFDSLGSFNWVSGSTFYLYGITYT